MPRDPSVSAPGGRRLLISTTAIALVAGIGALGLAHHLARTVETASTRVASRSSGVIDPDVTGSIGPAARSVVLDPCNGNQRLLVRGP